MKITNSNIRKALGAYKKQEVKENNSKKAESSRLKRKDEFEISNEGKKFQAIMKKLKDTPDVRQQKIDELKARINSGSYKVDSDEIAKKMLSRYDTSK